MDSTRSFIVVSEFYYYLKSVKKTVPKVPKSINALLGLWSPSMSFDALFTSADNMRSQAMKQHEATTTMTTKVTATKHKKKMVNMETKRRNLQ